MDRDSCAHSPNTHHRIRGIWHKQKFSLLCEPSQINYPRTAPHAIVKNHFCQNLRDPACKAVLELCHHAQLPTLAQLVKPHERAEASGVHVCEPLVSAAVRAATLRDVELEPSLAARQ